MPNSLAFHDMGLSTFISNSNMDANGVPISSDKIYKVKRMRHLNRISSSNRSHDRNLKNAFAILDSVKDKLSINFNRKICIYLSKGSRQTNNQRKIDLCPDGGIYLCCLQRSQCVKYSMK